MRSLKALAKVVAVETGRRIMLRGVTPRVVVLCYHSVHPTKFLASATPALFEEHVSWLKAHCLLVPFSQVMSNAATPSSHREPVVAITFDDGYLDNYEHAFPVLAKADVPATFFLTVGLVEKDSAVVERFTALCRVGVEDVRPLTWSQAREMRRAGMEFGSHTYSHPNLARLEERAAEDELRRSKERMEDRLGEPVRLVAYPFGKPKRHFTQETVRIVSRLGYEYAAAITCRPVRASQSRYAVPRFYVTRDSVATLREKILGAWDLVGYWQERVPSFLQT